MRVSVISTVLNEESSVGRLLCSLQEQTLRPDEIVICDGGSTDRTAAIIADYARMGLPVRVIESPGANISQGRNRAVAASSGDIIASTDAGVVLAASWLEELVRPFLETSPPPDVVSGFFEPDPHSVFETVMGATVLPALRDIRPEAFLPSSRSVAYTRAAWLAVGGYPEWLDYCEDLVFDLALRRAGYRFVFAPRAVVCFRPRSSLQAFVKQYYHYARGDGKADLWRQRHAVRYITYSAAPLLALLGFRYPLLWVLLAGAALAYCWSPYRRLWPYLRQWKATTRLYALVLVPIIRFTGDVAKMIGYPVGILWRRRHRDQGRL